MITTDAVPAEVHDGLDNERLVGLAKGGEARAFRLIMKRHNRRLYRTARGILGDDAEAEDVVQEAYLRAFANLGSFRGESSFTTWLTRIAINEALGRRRRRRPTVDLKELDLVNEQGDARVISFPVARAGNDPENDAARGEMRRLLESAVDGLPDAFRVVFVLREIEQLSVEETAAQLELRPETVKTRLHRARRLLRESLTKRLGPALPETYAFAGERCERITVSLLQRMGLNTSPV